MKQKIVIRVSMKKGQKYRSKVLKIAASVSGNHQFIRNVEKISLEGEDKDKLEVIGEVDAIELTDLLRKGFGSAQLESVSAVDGKDKDKDKEEPGICWTNAWGLPYQSYCNCYLHPSSSSYYTIW
ncbi:uncharacterized protein LOC111011290 [Momordica charantia]|uniref:Uncharacterized protein LOC111011290 n=1 Tax=Momordica charantia TaxID=3673 RepID=A0A6J1CIJ8_MOMCH|nr:uncharacterized protein LOC111011290 [Momordica charantia]